MARRKGAFMSKGLSGYDAALHLIFVVTGRIGSCLVRQMQVR